MCDNFPNSQQANIPYDVLETTSADHAKEVWIFSFAYQQFKVGRTIDLDRYSLVASVSGDGMVSTLLQGIAERCDFDREKMKKMFDNFGS